MEEIIKLVPLKYQKEIGGVVRNGCSRGVFESVPATTRKGISYLLTNDAQKKYADLKSWKVIERKGRTPLKRPAVIAASAPVPEPEQPPNISREALSLTDQISQVVGQNAQYREVLASIHKLIGDLLNPPTKQPQPAIEEKQ